MSPVSFFAHYTEKRLVVQDSVEFAAAGKTGAAFALDQS
jgi:hypothetical protein